MDLSRWQKIRDLFERAFDLDSTARAKFLDEQCGGDDSLRRQVESLMLLDGTPLQLSVAAGIESLLQHPAGADAAEGDAVRIGQYLVLRRLDEGGMGIVYEALQDYPRRTVALKMLRAGALASQREIHQFEREAEALGRLQHPGIATIHESGVTPAGLPYLVMEFVQGETLDKWVARQPALALRRKPQLRPRLNLFLKICDAITYAHQRGIIHRDLKPSNIMVLETAEGTQVKILDFGLARLSGEASGFTSPGTVMGSVRFMSPEQAQGESNRIDTRTDVYSLGVILYQLICDRHPYLEGPSDLVESLKTVVEVEPAPLRKVAPEVPADLETIVAKALEKQPDHRYGGAGALSSDIRSFLDDQPITARPASTVYQLRKLVARNKLAVAALVTVLVLLAGFAIFMKRERDRANRETVTAQASGEFLMNLFRDADPYDNGKPLEVPQLLQIGRERVSKNQSLPPAVRARLLYWIGNALNSRGPSKEAAAALRESLAIRRASPNENVKEHAATWVSLSTSLYNLGNYRESADAALHAVAILEQSFGPAHPNLANPLAMAGDSLSRDGRYSQAETQLKRAIEIDRAAGTESVGSVDRKQLLGSLYRRSGRIEEAVVVLREATALMARVGGKKRLPKPLHELGTALSLSGRPVEAAKVLAQSRAATAEYYGAAHANVAVVALNQAAALLDQSKPDEAAKEVEWARDAWLKTKIGEHPRFADILECLGRTQTALRKYQEGAANLQASLDMRRRLKDPATAFGLIELARNRSGGGALTAAKAALDEAALDHAIKPTGGAPEKAGGVNDRRLRLRWRLAEGEWLAASGRAEEASQRLAALHREQLAILGRTNHPEVLAVVDAWLQAETKQAESDRAAIERLRRLRQEAKLE